ncbi:MAG: penicillin-insensitive murein endopeptidase [Pseudomonadota bacterium]
MIRPLLFAAALAAACGATQAQAKPLAKTLFGSQAEASAQAPAPLGSYAKGCLAGGVRIDETAPGWQAMRLSRNRNWGHPEALRFLQRLAGAAQGAGTPRLLLGDVSQPRGGPMTSGHASHQIGLDLDIWFRAGDADPWSRADRERIGAWSVVAGDRRSINDNWTVANQRTLRAAAEDPAVARIFVNAAIKRHLCVSESRPRPWLRKVRPWWGHDAHFHVRLACPAGAAGCVEQAPPPAGDGCDATLDWWFSDEALNPPPPKGPRKPRARDVMTLADLPADCRRVLDAD